MSNKWQLVKNGMQDTGAGALRYTCMSVDYPGLERVQIRPYAKGRGRGNVETYYRVGGETFDTLAAAVRHAVWGNAG